MSEPVRLIKNPKVQEKLREKLAELKARREVVKVDAEVVDETALTVKKPKFMDLATSEHYIQTFLDKTPEEINSFIDRQSDLLMMYSKNAALELLAKAVETNDADALEMYLKVVQASAVVAQEKVAVKKLIGVTPEDTPKQYKASEMSPEDWEKTFKPGQPVVPSGEPPKDPIWMGKGNPKSVN